MKRVFIWGAAESSRKVYEMLQQQSELKVVAIADKNVQKRGQMLYGMKIITPEEICQ